MQIMHPDSLDKTLLIRIQNVALFQLIRNLEYHIFRALRGKYFKFGTVKNQIVSEHSIFLQKVTLEQARQSALMVRNVCLPKTKVSEGTYKIKIPLRDNI